MGNPARTVEAYHAVRDWRHASACRDMDPELFFPTGYSGRAVERQVAEARAVCASCPVAVSCLRWAVETGQEAGIWAGITEEDRDPLARAYTAYLTAAAAADVELRAAGADRLALAAAADLTEARAGYAMTLAAGAGPAELEAAAEAAGLPVEMPGEPTRLDGALVRLLTAARRAALTLHTVSDVPAVRAVAS